MLKEKDIKEFEKKIKINFRKVEILQQAFTSSSYANLHNLEYDNENLEFLGDSVLNFVVSAYLYKKYPLYTVGKLTKLKSDIVSGRNLSRWANKLGILKYFPKEIKQKVNRTDLLEDTFEAIIGAIYLDRGITQAKKFIFAFLTNFSLPKDLDYKSKLQIKLQKAQKVLVYQLEKVIESKHHKIFKSSVYCNEVKLGEGEGKSKKESEQMAAKQGLKTIRAGG